MIETKECPVCGGTQFSKFNACIDYTVSHETFQIAKCISCNLLVTSPRPEDNDLGKYYQSEKYISHTNKASTLIDKVYLLARRFTLQKKLNLLQKFKSPGSILDYGCGTGEFLNTCKSSGWIISGVEPSPAARQKATHLTNSGIQPSLDQIKEKQDAITLWHVLEHVPNLDETLKKLSALLHENGTLFIAVPNYKSFDASHYKNAWAAYDAPRHLWHFDQSSMTKLLAKNSLKLEAILPMTLDSFYVSMLSEKYKNHEKQTLSGLIKAFYIGLKSNLLARKENNFSSLIYIARK